jgi:hypothetical protein
VSEGAKLDPAAAHVALIETATAMIEGKIDLIEGVRKLSNLRHYVSNPNSEVFLPIRGVESETDHFPVGERRNSYSQSYLNKVDAELDEYLRRSKSSILDACRQIVQTFS